MKINFTKKEYGCLLEIIYLGNWVATAHDLPSSELKSEHEKVAQKIYSYAKEMGFENLIELDQGSGEYFETREFEESSSVQSEIDEYNEETFWDELISRLAERDAVRTVGEKAFMKLSIEEKMELVHGIEQKYYIEFENNGLNNLELKET